ncbi:hypothetical protein ACVWWK_007536 [Bradyrhizobium sp. LB9.1b]
MGPAVAGGAPCAQRAKFPVLRFVKDPTISEGFAHSTTAPPGGRPVGGPLLERGPVHLSELRPSRRVACGNGHSSERQLYASSSQSTGVYAFLATEPERRGRPRSGEWTLQHDNPNSHFHCKLVRLPPDRNAHTYQPMIVPRVIRAKPLAVLKQCEEMFLLLILGHTHLSIEKPNILASPIQREKLNDKSKALVGRGCSLRPC